MEHAVKISRGIRSLASVFPRLQATAVNHLVCHRHHHHFVHREMTKDSTVRL